jgi:hypothetical protein
MSTIELPLEVSDQVIEDIIDGAGYSIGYWAESGHHDPQNKTYSFIESEEGLEHKVSYQDIVEAIGKVVKREVGVRSDIRDAIVLDLIDYDDASRMDAEVYDVVIQVAALGEITYG